MFTIHFHVEEVLLTRTNSLGSLGSTVLFCNSINDVFGQAGADRGGAIHRSSNSRHGGVVYAVLYSKAMQHLWYIDWVDETNNDGSHFLVEGRCFSWRETL